MKMKKYSSANQLFRRINAVKLMCEIDFCLHMEFVAILRIDIVI